MTTTPAPSVLAQFCVDDALPIDASSFPIEAISSTVKMTQTHYRSPGLRGTRSRFGERVRITREHVGGQLVMEPTATEIDWWIEKILGGTTAAGVTDVDETVPEFYMAVDKITKVPIFNKLKVAKCVISGSSGQPIRFTLDLEGEDETTGAAASFPSLTMPTDDIFICSDVVLTLGGSAREINEFALTIDNMLLVDLYRNSISRVEIPASDRMVQLTATPPYTSDNSDLYDAAIAGAAATLVISDGTATYTFAAANAKIPAVGPDVPAAGGEIVLPLTVDWYADASDSECKCTKS